jgi:hypothetical protein
MSWGMSLGIGRDIKEDGIDVKEEKKSYEETRKVCSPNRRNVHQM